MPDTETLYLMVYDLTKIVEAQGKEIAFMRDFIQSKFPGELSPQFVGENGELGIAEDIKPVVLESLKPVAEPRRAHDFTSEGGKCTGCGLTADTAGPDCKLPEPDFIQGGSV